MKSVHYARPHCRWYNTQMLYLCFSRQIRTDHSVSDGVQESVGVLVDGADSAHHGRRSGAQRRNAALRSESWFFAIHVFLWLQKQFLSRIFSSLTPPTSPSSSRETEEIVL